MKAADQATGWDKVLYKRRKGRESNEAVPSENKRVKSSNMSSMQWSEEPCSEGESDIMWLEVAAASPRLAEPLVFHRPLVVKMEGASGLGTRQRTVCTT